MQKSGARFAWVDVAKAGAIVLVVFHHIAVSASSQLMPGSDSLVVEFWAKFSNSMLPLRMPVFFFAAGMLAANAVHRPWSLLWRRRFGDLLWPFLLWSVIFSFVGAFRYRPESPSEYMADSLKTIPFGGNAYWFLSILVLFFAVARIFRNALPAIALLALAAFGVASLIDSFIVESLEGPNSLALNVARACYFSIWYFVGLSLRDQLGSVDRVVRIGTAIVGVVLYGGISYAVYFAGVGQSIRAALYQVLALIGVVAVVHISVLVAKSQRLAEIAYYLSRRTLPIYVLHPILLSLLVVGVRAMGEGPVSLPVNNLLVDLVLFPALTVLLVIASVLLYDVAIRIGASWLFELPGRRSRAPGRESSRGAPTDVAGSASAPTVTH